MLHCWSWQSCSPRRACMHDSLEPGSADGHYMERWYLRIPSKQGIPSRMPVFLLVHGGIACMCRGCLPRFCSSNSPPLIRITRLLECLHILKIPEAIPFLPPNCKNYNVGKFFGGCFGCILPLEQLCHIRRTASHLFFTAPSG